MKTQAIANKGILLCNNCKHNGIVYVCVREWVSRAGNAFAIKAKDILSTKNGLLPSSKDVEFRPRLETVREMDHHFYQSTICLINDETG